MNYKMPKQIISPKMNMQNLFILAIFLIGSLILYRMIIGVRSQCIALQKDFEALKMTQSKQNNAVVNVFENSSPIHNDDNISLNSVEIDSILRKINSEPEDMIVNSTDGCINEAVDSGDGVESALKIIETTDDSSNDCEAMNEILIVNQVEVDDGCQIINDENNDFSDDNLENYTEESLKKKQLGELKNILKKQNKQIKGNKLDLIKTILE